MAQAETLCRLCSKEKNPLISILEDNPLKVREKMLNLLKIRVILKVFKYFMKKSVVKCKNNIDRIVLKHSIDSFSMYFRFYQHLPSQNKSALSASQNSINSTNFMFKFRKIKLYFKFFSMRNRNLLTKNQIQLQKHLT